MGSALDDYADAELRGCLLKTADRYTLSVTCNGARIGKLHRHIGVLHVTRFVRHLGFTIWEEWPGGREDIEGACGCACNQR